MSSPSTINGGFQVHNPSPAPPSPIPTSSTPLLHFSGVPFSWEHCPGIPKKINNHPSINNNLLPLPPAGNCSTNSNLKSKKTKKTPRDPFLAAILECSRSDNEDDDGHEDSDHREINFWKGSKAVTRILSDRFGFINLYTASCKRTCPVSESIIYVARPGGAHYQRRRGPAAIGCDGGR